MSNFRLQFATQESVEGNMIRNGHERIIATAGNIQTARLIAEAMLGEEVASSEYLAVVEVVEQTKEKPTLNCWTEEQESAIWIKVIEKLSLDEDDAIFICDGPHRVGLRIMNLAKLTTASSH